MTVTDGLSKLILCSVLFFTSPTVNLTRLCNIKTQSETSYLYKTCFNNLSMVFLLIFILINYKHHVTYKFILVSKTNCLFPRQNSIFHNSSDRKCMFLNCSKFQKQYRPLYAYNSYSANTFFQHFTQSNFPVYLNFDSSVSASCE